MASRRLLVLCALTCVCVATKLPPAVENAVDFCVSSRWGFSCFDASASGRGMMARAGLANFGRMVGRGALVTMGAALARETWVTIKELQQSQAGMAHPAEALRQWLLEGPLPPATAAAACSADASPSKYLASSRSPLTCPSDPHSTLACPSLL